MVVANRNFVEHLAAHLCAACVQLYKCRSPSRSMLHLNTLKLKIMCEIIDRVVITFIQQTGNQPGIVANPARRQLERQNIIFPVPVRA